jgi:tRNA pseudouridine55 synthase
LTDNLNPEEQREEEQRPEVPEPEFANRIFLIDKPLDFTSADIVRIFRKKFNLKKAGHSGTLDPKATGLLILCSGKMTKKINEFIEYDKEYEGIIKLGAVTKSFDTETEEENVLDYVNVSDEEIEAVRETFLGETQQMPPMYSAIKHKGKPLYKLARKGRSIERAFRKITVTDFEVRRAGERELFFRISSSKGTYIRTVANDFGKKLGTGGYLKELRRTRIGNFELKHFENEERNIRYQILD